MIQCPYCEGQGYHAQPQTIYQRVTKEMASDAGDLTLEGYPVYAGENFEQTQCDHCEGSGLTNEEPNTETSDRLRCPDCGIPTIPDRHGLTYEETLCNSCHSRNEEVP